MRVESCACFNQLVGGCIGQPAIAVLGGGAASCSLFTFPAFVVCFASNFTVERVGSALQLACSQKTLHNLLWNAGWEIGGEHPPSWGCPMGAVPPPPAPAFFLPQASCALHNPEQKLLRDGRVAWLVLFVSLHQVGPSFCSDSEFSLHPCSLDSCLTPELSGIFVPPNPPFPLWEDGGSFLLLLFCSVNRMKTDEVIGVYTGRFGLHFLFTRTALVMNNGASNYSLQAIYSWDLAPLAVWELPANRIWFLKYTHKHAAVCPICLQTYLGLWVLSSCSAPVLRPRSRAPKITSWGFSSRTGSGDVLWSN